MAGGLLQIEERVTAAISRIRAAPRASQAATRVPAVGTMAQIAVGVSRNDRNLNALDIRDQKSRDADGEIVTDKEGTDFYYYLLEELGVLAPEYASLDDPNERRILVPLVAAVVGGNVVDTHLSTVESQTDPYVPLTVEQHAELLDIYK